MSEPIVRTARPEEQERIFSLQTLAFAGDPPMRALFPEARTYLEHFPGFAKAFGGRAFEHATAFVAGDCAGAALWLPPGVHADAESIGAVVAAALPQAQLEETGGVLEEMAAYHIDEPHWYLPMIGVDPACQGQGIGSALLRHVLARVDADQLPAYLEASRPENVPLYVRHGFEVLGEIGGDDFPVVTPMLRRAR